MSKAGKMPFTERALAQLTLVRFREFIREPEVLFWVFVFPILLAAGLGIAFRNRPPEVLKIAATTAELARSLAGEKLLRVEHLPQAEAEEALRVGKVALVAGPGANGAVVYGYDPTNHRAGRERRGGLRLRPHESRRPHRAHAGRWRGGARGGPHRPGGLHGPSAGGAWFALYRLPHPGPGGHEPDGQRHVGHRIHNRGRAPKEVDQAHGGDAHAASLLPALVHSLAPVSAGGGSGRAARFRRAGVPRAGARPHYRPGGAVRAGVDAFLLAGIADRLARADHRSGFRTDERRDDADVDLLRRLFFGATLSGRSAANHQSAASDGGDRRSARQHAARCGPGAGSPANRRDGRVDGGLFRAGADAVPLALRTRSAFSRDGAAQGLGAGARYGFSGEDGVERIPQR